MIEIRKVCHGFLKKSLFQNVNIRLLPNERYGIVGANGSGKSTMLKILARELDADSGEIDIKAGLDVYRIGQDHNLSDDARIIDTAMMGKASAFDAIMKKEALLGGEIGSHDSADEIARLEEIIVASDGYRLRSHAEAILEGLGLLKAEQEKPLKTLSGGYKWRVFLAQALIRSPDVLMLDEPTNHLDIVSIRWLELFLASYGGMVVLVSHDKRFMDSVCTHILDIDFDTVTPYAGNYSSFDRARKLFLAQKANEILSQEKEIQKKQAFIERFRYKASKARQAQSRVKQLEKIEIIEPIRTSRVEPKFRFDIDEPGSREVLSVKTLSKSYGDKAILTDVSFDVRRGDRIAIIGPNGSGKSTLIKALAQEFPECNRSIKWGHGVGLGYFAQDCGAKIKTFGDSALAWLWQHCADKPQSYVQGFLGRVLLSKDDANKGTKNLSGGELGRLFLAYLMMKRPNALLLDEPTNHLDLESIESLTEALRAYKGTLIVVSHDRMFIEKIASRIIEITPAGVRDRLGTYSEFIANENRHDYFDAAQEIKSGRKKGGETSKNAISYLEQKKRKSNRQRLIKHLEKIMTSVADLEKRICGIEQKFSQDGFFEENDFAAVAKLEQEKILLNKSLLDLMDEWERTEKDLQENAEDEKDIYWMP